MTALTHRVPPEILAARHAQRGRFRALTTALVKALAANVNDSDRPWSIGIDAFVLAGFLVLMCWETGEFAYTGLWEHLAAAAVVLVAATVYAFRAFTTPTRSETNR